MQNLIAADKEINALTPYKGKILSIQAFDKI